MMELSLRKKDFLTYLYSLWNRNWYRAYRSFRVELHGIVCGNICERYLCSKRLLRGVIIFNAECTFPAYKYNISDYMRYTKSSMRCWTVGTGSWYGNTMVIARYCDATIMQVLDGRIDYVVSHSVSSSECGHSTKCSRALRQCAFSKFRFGLCLLSRQFGAALDAVDGFLHC